MSLKRQRPPSPPTSDANSIYRSSPILDRASTFCALFSPTLTAKHLQSLPELKSATHRIAAWRTPSAQRSPNPSSTTTTTPLLSTGFSDDGEKYGGKTIEKLLVSLNVSGAVVVGRHYGGVMLGPVRFDHIRNCATEAILQWQQEQKERLQEANSKRVKTTATEEEEEGGRREELVKVLGERDASIMILRQLLAEKKKEEGKGGSEGGAGIGRKMDYGRMPVAALERLERAKDQTIGWILGEIEKEEEREREDQEAVRMVEKTQKEEKEEADEEEVLEARTSEIMGQKQRINDEATRSLGSVEELSTPSTLLLESKSIELMEPG